MRTRLPLKHSLDVVFRVTEVALHLICKILQGLLLHCDCFGRCSGCVPYRLACLQIRLERCLKLVRRLRRVREIGGGVSPSASSTLGTAGIRGGRGGIRA